MKFYIEHSGEQNAGINPYSETITMGAESGDYGGEPGEFEEYIKQTLAEWYDGATVMTEHEYQKIIKQENEMIEEQYGEEVL